MTEATIELLVEKAIDSLDDSLIRGFITQDEYEQDLDQIDAWARRQYDLIKKG